MTSSAQRESEASLAGAAMGHGIFALARSFRFHRPRGAFCHQGWCQQCKVRLSDGRNVLACQAPASDLALLVRPSPLLRAVGRVAEAFPPWFHEKRLLRPRFMRQVYLRTLRYLSGALPLPALPATPAGKRWTTTRCQTLVVGGGPAGMKAATLLKRAGRDVLLVEAADLGRSARAHALYPSLRAEFDAAQVAFKENTTCLGLYDDGRRAMCVDAIEVSSVDFDELVVATGAYDRLLTFPGNDLPGIVGLRGLEKLLRAGQIEASLRVGVFLAGDHLDRALDALSSAGHKPAWIAVADDAAPRPGTLLQNARIARVNGRSRIRSVELESGQTLPCDLLVLGFSQPTYELQLQAGQKISLSAPGGPLCAGTAAETGVLVVGEAAGAVTIPEALAQASQATERWLTHRDSDVTSPARPSSPATIPDDSAFLCVCEDVRVGDVRKAIAAGFDDVELIKRRTGAGTGPCQGKLCHPELARCLAEHGLGVRLPTIRPLLRPTSLFEFCGRRPD